MQQKKQTKTSKAKINMKKKSSSSKIETMKKITVEKPCQIDKMTGTNDGESTADESKQVLPNRNHWDVTEATGLPTFASDLYDNLPYVLREICSMVSTDERDMMLVGSLAAVSSTLYNVTSSYDQHTIYPPIYALIEAAAGSGKGRLNLCRRLVEKIDRQRSLMVSVDISVPQFVDTLQKHGGVGFLFNTEIDLLSSVLRGQNGKKMSVFLRFAFSHERFCHSTKLGDTTVELPRLAVLISGTFDQMRNLFSDKDFNNGLYTRFLIYHRELTDELRGNLLHNTDEAQALEDRIEALSTYFYKSWTSLQQRARAYRLTSTQEMSDQLYQWLKTLLAQRQDTGWDAQLSGLIKRYGEIAWRVTMTLTMLRYAEQHREEPLPKHPMEEKLIEVKNEDFLSALNIVQTLFFHTISHLRSMLKLKQQRIGKLEKKRLDAVKVLERLPRVFSRRHYVKAACKMLHIKERTAYRYFDRLEDDDKIEQKSPRKWKQQ